MPTDLLKVPWLITTVQECSLERTIRNKQDLEHSQSFVQYQIVAEK